MVHQTVLILDFGSQYTQLIARRVRELSVYAEIVPFSTPVAELSRRRPIALVLSGGPASVYEEGAPHVPVELFGIGVPVLGVCYGAQLMAELLGGKVVRSNDREFGPATLDLCAASFLGAAAESHPVWMSHGDRIDAAPPGFAVFGTSGSAPFAAMGDPSRGLFAIQFHPEVSHTRHGSSYLRRFLYDVCGATGDWSAASFVEEAIGAIAAQVGGGRVVLGISGGVDSSVAAVLLHRALGDRVDAIFVDNGLLREGEGERVVRELSRLGPRLHHVDASELFLERLTGITDPEAKRKAIGAAFIDVFEAEARRIGDVQFLAQGTIYPDVIESTSVVGPSHVIKSHHNVGGLKERMGLSLVEPLRRLFKDEVRRAGAHLGLSDAFVHRQPFPGPGLGVRVIGEVTRERLALLRAADAIFTAEIEAAGLHDPRSAAPAAQYFAVLLPVQSVGVMGDVRTYENVVALRAVATSDFMTADFCRLPYDLLARASSRIVNEVRGVNRVVYDVSSKPPATIEWE
ncbi:MAG: glutamine-hydrolyzing GMP synthase [Acidobacteriota bacterium]